MVADGVRFALLSLACTFVNACDGCDQDQPGITREKHVWGREPPPPEIQKKAAEEIDAYLLEERPDLKNRVLSMSFEEIVERLGFVEYRGAAIFQLTRNQHDLRIVEDSLIQQGLHGSFRVLGRDEAGNITREIIYDNGVLYARNGPGKLYVEGITKKQHLAVRAEAWQPLRVFTSYYGPRLGLRKIGPASSSGRHVASYAFELLDGPPLVEVPGFKGSKKPLSLAGKLMVDESSGVPVAADFHGVLEIPAGEQSPPGRLELTLKFALNTIEETEIKPQDFVPTVKRRTVDLDPLAFLDGGTRTSTTIGGATPLTDDE